MKKRHVIGLLVLSVALSHALAPAIAWAQAKAQNAFYSLTVTDTVTASGDVTADQYVASGSASQYSCSKTDGTCQFSSATADGTTSSTVGSFTLKAGANINAADLLLDVQDSAGAHALTVTEAGDVTQLGTTHYFGGVTNGTYVVTTGSQMVWYFANAGELLVTNSAISPNSSGGLDLGLTGTRFFNGYFGGTVDLSKATGDALTAVGGGYSRFTFNAGAPTATDCDAAGESGRIAIDTANNRFYFCNGAAWQYVNEDVP